MCFRVLCPFVRVFVRLFSAKLWRSLAFLRQSSSRGRAATAEERARRRGRGREKGSRMAGGPWVSIAHSSLTVCCSPLCSVRLRSSFPCTAVGCCRHEPNSENSRKGEKHTGGQGEQHGARTCGSAVGGGRLRFPRSVAASLCRPLLFLSFGSSNAFGDSAAQACTHRCTLPLLRFLLFVCVVGWCLGAASVAPCVGAHAVAQRWSSECARCGCGC
jgi:hypothetical protein